MKKLYYSTQLIVALAAFLACNQDRSSNLKLEYPELKVSKVTDTYFGTRIVDEHRVMEDLENQAVKDWIADEQKLYTNVIDHILGKDSLIKEIEEYEFSSNVRATIPRASENKIFFKRHYIKENYDAIFYRDVVSNEETELVNTKGMSGITIGYCEPSFNGDFAAIGVESYEGEKIVVFDVEKRTPLSDTINNAPYAFPNWHPNGSGFFYSKLRDPQNGEDGMYENAAIKFHKIDTNPEKDIEVFSNLLNKTLGLSEIDFPNLITFPSSNKLLAIVYHGNISYCLGFCSNIDDVLKNPSRAHWTNVGKVEDKTTAYTISKDKLYRLTYKSDPNGEVEEISLSNANDRKIVIEGTDLVLKEIIENKSGIFVKYLKDGVNGLLEFDPSTPNTREIQPPFNSSITLSSDVRWYIHSDFLYVGLSSWTHEYGVYKYDNHKFSLSDIRPQGTFGNPDYLVSEEVSVRSHDGAIVPLSIVYDKNIKKDGTNPTILTAYGAYGDIMEPRYDQSRLAWFRRGGIYAVAHVRGGGEKGDEWYRSGFKDRKANSWKDFVACAEYLIDNGFTSREKLAAETASAGAITIGRAITDRPELFKAAIIRVGVLNSTRFENSKNNISVTEFGTSKDSIEFKYLYDMDVYHHINKTTQYPSMLFTASMNDQIVEAWQPAKVVAKLQQNPDNLVLFRVGDDGHFRGLNAFSEVGETYAFLLWQLGNPDFSYVK